MRVMSVNVGLPREVEWRGKKVLTAIFKDPVAAKLPLRRLNLDGDGQADLTVHGGPDKAVYAYPGEHYGPWREQLGRELTPGNFGENLTTEGLLEDAVHIGDEFRVGTARLVVTQPRMPCFKLGLRFDDPGVVKSFLQAGKPGIYFAVLEEGWSAPATRSNASPRMRRESPLPKCSVSCSIETPTQPRCGGYLACRLLRPSGEKSWKSVWRPDSTTPSPGEASVAEAGL